MAARMDDIDLTHTQLNAGDAFYDLCCAPCTKNGFNTEASKYCASCQEHFCVDCVRYHNSFKALSKHVLVNPNVAKPSSSTSGGKFQDSPTELCQKHQLKLVDMYCQDHDLVGCSVCMTLEHRSCDGIHYIPEYVQSNFPAEQVHQVNNNLTTAIKAMKKLKTQHDRLDDNLDKRKATCKQDIQKYREDINQIIDKIEATTLAELDARHKDTKQKSDDMHQHTLDVHDEMVRFKSEIESDESNDSQKFVIAKLSQRTIMQGQELQSGLLHDQTTQMTFTRNTDIMTFLLRIVTLGMLSSPEIQYSSLSTVTTSSHQPRQTQSTTSSHQPRQTQSTTSSHQPRQTQSTTSSHQPRQTQSTTSSHKPRQTQSTTSSHQPQQTQSTTSSHQPQQTQSTTSSHQPQQTLSTTSSHQPQQTQSTTSSHQPQQIQSTTSSHQPQQIQSTTSSHQPQQIQSTTSSHQPQQTLSTTSSHQPQQTQSTTSSQQPQQTQSTTSSHQPQQTQSTTSSHQPQQTQSTTSSHQPQQTQSTTSSQQPQQTQSTTSPSTSGDNSNNKNVSTRPQDTTVAKKPLKQGLYKVSDKRTYNIKHPDDDNEICDIWSSCILDNGDILLVDRRNKKLKLVDNRTYIIRSTLVLADSPWSVCRVSSTEAAVCLSRTIQFVSTHGGQLVPVRSLSMKRDCTCIAVMRDKIYIGDEQSVYIYTLNGELLKTIRNHKSGTHSIFSEDIFSLIKDITVSDDENMIHVADRDNGVITLNTDGNVVWRYSGTARRVCTDGNGNVIVCGYGSHNMIQLSPDGQYMGEMATLSNRVVDPRTVSYDKINHKLIVGQCKNSNITVFTVQ